MAADKSEDLIRASCIWRRNELARRATPGPPECDAKKKACAAESEAHKAWLAAVDAYLAIPPTPP